MQVYLVGGAVRDRLLGRDVTEHDYVVVGATPQHMLDFGFSQVGADFPVFLHPHTHEEYALARTERKSGAGYLGFSVDASPDVTLAEDLIRRDLTINAMAIEVVGLFNSRIKSDNIIDPYGGQADLDQKYLRHVSTAFAEDPVRVLRLARFASRYAPLGFSIADETATLVRQMRDSGELNYLVAERVWAETRRALMQHWGDVYFDSLNEMAVLNTLFPTLTQAIESHAQYWQLAKSSLRLADTLGLDEISRFALLCSVFLSLEAGKPVANSALFNGFCTQLKVPKQHVHFAQLFLTQQQELQNFNQLSAEALYALITSCNALKQPETLRQLLTCSTVYKLANTQARLDKVLAILQPIGIKEVDSRLQGKAIGEAIERLRLEKLADFIANDTSSSKR